MGIYHEWCVEAIIKKIRLKKFSRNSHINTWIIGNNNKLQYCCTVIFVLNLQCIRFIMYKLSLPSRPHFAINQPWKRPPLTLIYQSLNHVVMSHEGLPFCGTWANSFSCDLLCFSLCHFLEKPHTFVLKKKSSGIFIIFSDILRPRRSNESILPQSLVQTTQKEGFKKNFSHEENDKSSAGFHW